MQPTEARGRLVIETLQSPEARLVIAMVIVAIGGAVSGLTAFGFALVVVPPLLLIAEPRTVTATVVLLTFVTRWIVFMETRRAIDWRFVAALAPAGVIGAFLGARVLAVVDERYIELLAGIVVVGTAVALWSGRRLPGSHSPAAAPLAGLASGLLTTTTGMGGPPVVLLTTAREYAVAAFRGSVTASFFVVSLAAPVALVREGLLTREVATGAALLLPAALLGTLAGTRTLRVISQGQFRRAVLVLLMITGFIAAASALRELLT